MKKLAALLVLLASNVFADQVTIFTTSGAGSLSDQVARYIQPLLAKELGAEVVVVNAPGGNGVVGLRAFNQSGAGNILIGSFAVPYVAKALPQTDFSPTKDFAPVVGLIHPPMHVLVPASSPARTIDDLAELSRSRQGLKGGSSHPSADISMMLLDKALGTKTEVINYRQLGQLYVDLAAARIDYTFGGATSAASALIQGGQLRSLGRLDQTGVPDFSWTALMVKLADEGGKAARAARRVVNAENMRGLPQPFFDANSDRLRQIISREYSLIPN